MPPNQKSTPSSVNPDISLPVTCFFLINSLTMVLILSMMTLFSHNNYVMKANSIQELIDPLKPFSTSSTSLFSDSYIFSLIISHWSSSPKPSKTSRLLSLFLYKRYISFAWATISSKMSSSSASSSSWTGPLDLLLLNRGDLEPPLPALPTNLELLLHLPALLLLLAGPPLGLDDTPVLS